MTSHILYLQLSQPGVLKHGQLHKQKVHLDFFYSNMTKTKTKLHLEQYITMIM